MLFISEFIFLDQPNNSVFQILGYFMLIETLVKSATFGFGASAGRDFYKWVKKHPLLSIVILGTLVLLGWRNLYLGVGKSYLYRIFITYLGSLLLIVPPSYYVIILSVSVASAEDIPAEDKFWVALIGPAIVFLFALVGSIWGLKSRRKIKRQIYVEKQNKEFLDQLGFQDSGVGDDLIRDAEGNFLKLKEHTEEKIIFTVSGRRGLRAAINLDRGEMTSYTGIIKVA